MKRIVATIIMAAIICTISSCGRGDNTEQESVSRKSPDVSASAVASGQAITENEHDHANQTYIKSKVTEMSGKEQVLDLGWINMQNRPAKLSVEGLATKYAQVKDGHYYYLKQDRSGQYIVLYRDRGEKVAKIKCKMKEVVMGATLEDDILYLFCYDREVLWNEDDYDYFMKCANIKTGTVDEILLGDGDHGSYSVFEYPTDEGDYFVDDYWITEKYLYAYKYSDGTWRHIDRSTGVIDDTFNLYEKDLLVKNKLLIDGKIYYMESEERTSDHSHALVQIDLEKKERRILFRYTPQVGGVTLEEISEDGIYIWEHSGEEEALYKIPLHNGKIEKVESYASKRHSAYENHLVYIDNKNRMHVVNREKKTDTVIKNNFKGSFTCAKEGIFIMNRDVDWLERDDDDDDESGYKWNNDVSLPLYYMDYNGGNMTQLRKEVEP